MNTLFFIMTLLTGPNLDGHAPCHIDINGFKTSMVLVDSKAALVRMTNNTEVADIFYLPHMSTKEVAFTKFGHADVYADTEIERVGEITFLDFEQCSDRIPEEMEEQIINVIRTYRTNRYSKVVLTASTIGDSTDRLIKLLAVLSDKGVRDQDIIINLRGAVGQESDDLVKIHVQQS